LTTDGCFFNNKIYFYIGKKSLLWKENCCCYASSFEKIKIGGRKNTARIVRIGKIGTIAIETKVQREWKIEKRCMRGIDKTKTGYDRSDN